MIHKLLIATIASITGACAASSASTPTSKTPGAGPASPYQTVLAATDIDGDTIGVERDKNATVVVVFASSCGACRHALAPLGELAAELPELRSIGVNAYEEYADRSDEERLRHFLASAAPWLRVVRADDALLRTLGGVSKIPTLFV